MKKHSENRGLKVMGIDLAKSSFHVHGEDADGRKAISQKFSRQKLKEYLVNLPPCIVAMEACAGAHYWALGEAIAIVRTRSEADRAPVRQALREVQ